MKILISEKKYLESEIEVCQKNIFFLNIENRLLEREKFSVGNSKLLEIENAVKVNKNKLDYFEKRITIMKEVYFEKFKEDIKIITK